MSKKQLGKIPNLKKPSLKILGFQMWVHGREFPDSQDYWDGNWLNVTVHCGRLNSDVWFTGSIVHLSELNRLKEDIEKLCITFKGVIILDTMEPYLRIEFETTSKENIAMKVTFTPDHMYEDHHYLFELDENQLRSCGEQLRNILVDYPIGNP